MSLTDAQRAQLQGGIQGSTSIGGGIADIISANRAIRDANENIKTATDSAGRSRKDILGYDFENAQAIRNRFLLGS